ncbi:MAG TPA: serine/threonine-protein kinase, partial [Pseudonocardiaceae bacterium]
RLVEGSDLASLLAQHGPLSPERAVNVVTQVASALDAAHAADLAHRDIKPSNILVTNSENESAGEFVYVADFGLARLTTDGAASLTKTGATVGSLDYMAPERFTGGHGDHRVDIYALGCLLFEALTAHGPFRAEGLPAIIHAHLNQPPPRPSQDRPDLPADLDAVVARAMAKNPDDRYSSAGALAEAARAAVSSPGPGTSAAEPFSRRETVVVARHPSWPDPAGPPASKPHQAASTIYSPPAEQQQRRRFQRPVLIGVAVVALVAAIIASFIVLLLPSNTAADEIHREPDRTPGVNPFMPPEGNDRPGVTPPPGSGGTFNGNTSGLYGGTLNDSTCDRQAMITFLQAHPDKGAAWAGVQGISQAEVPNYISGLTPVLLRSDTAVTNHGFADGQATTLNSVLKAGTAVLVDKYGLPRARCYCGNPLTPANQPATKTYVGPTWSGFSPASITTIQPTTTPITEFTLVNPFTNEVFYRPTGTTGQQDRPRTPPQPVYTTPSTAPPETTTPLPVQPTVQQPAQPQQPAVKDADIAGTYTLSRSLTSCTGFDTCYTNPMNIRIDGCHGGQCTMAWSDGWVRSHTLIFNGSSWQTSGSDEGANECNDRSQRPGSIKLELTVASAAVVNGVWKARTFRGTYSFESPAYADCNAGKGTEELYN